MTALRTTLAGDFGASITPARSGAEPARFLVLAEAGVPTPSALVVLFAELFLEALSLATVVIIVAIVFRHAGDRARRARGRGRRVCGLRDRHRGRSR